jgi:prephenate dehydratase
MTPAVGYLGPPGTHSHAALGGEGVPLPTIHDVVQAVATGALAAGLVPLENSTEGGVGATLDALAATPEVVIVGEMVHPVTYALVAAEAVDPAALATVVSHPQGLAQCAGWLREHAPGAAVVPAASTAEAVLAVVAGNLPGPAAALATPLAAQLHGGVVVAEGIADEAGNATRFVRIARAMAAPDLESASGPHRTSIAWWGDGDAAPGWLVRCLSEFAFRGVNLTRIESRPRRSQLGHYAFFADLDGAATDGPVADAIDGLRSQAENVRVLGSYPAAAVSPSPR